LCFVELNDLWALLTPTEVAKSVVAPQSVSKTVATICLEGDAISFNTLCEHGEQDVKITSAQTGNAFAQSKWKNFIGRQCYSNRFLDESYIGHEDHRHRALFRTSGPTVGYSLKETVPGRNGGNGVGPNF
jgi:hypothetical protein